MRLVTPAIVLAFFLGGCANLSEPAASHLPRAQPDLSLLSQHPQVAAALQQIVEMDPLNMQRLIEITEIPAPPFMEEKRAADFMQRLQASGLEQVWMDERGNVLGLRPGSGSSSGSGKTLALVAHLDTVFPPWTDLTVRQEGDRYFAPGIGDNSRGLVVLLSLLDVLQKNRIQTAGDLLFVGSVGEEGLGDLRGVRHLFRDDGPRIDSFIAIDGGSNSRIVVDAVGSIRYRLTVTGPGGHSYGAFGTGHPHQALARAITYFSEAARPFTLNPPKTTFSVGMIGGGTSVNSIPFESWLEVDMRSLDNQRLQQMDQALHQAVLRAVAEENALRTLGDALVYKLENIGLRPAGAGDRTSALVANASAALTHLGIEPQLAASSTDGNIPISLGIPAITMSRGGDSSNSHAPNESWRNVDSHLAIQALLLTSLLELGME